MAAIMLNAAAMAYRKAAAKTRDAMLMHEDSPPWLHYVGEQLQEDDKKAAPSEVIVESTYHRKERILFPSTNRYERLAWVVYLHITSTLWFEFFVLFNIVLVGITTGLELENRGRDPWTTDLSNYVTDITLGVFTLECLLKLVSEGFEPWRYFTDKELGTYNTFDFLIVIFSYAFIDSAGGGISALRMLRLIRLLSFIKYVPQLRVLISGLLNGVKSVIYIVLLLFLVIYIFGILGCILFGENDPNHFGDVSIAMVSLFQVSTLASWTSVAYVSWFGCEAYLGSPYNKANWDDSVDDAAIHTSRIHTMAGDFEGFRCDANFGNPFLTGVFFFLYILITSWVIMSLFIGVISMGMFETYIAMKSESHTVKYVNNLANNTMFEAQLRDKLDKANKRNALTIKEKIDLLLDDEAFDQSDVNIFSRCYHKFVEMMRKTRDHNYFVFLITACILVIGGTIGIDTNKTLHCQRLEFRLQERLKNDDDDASFTQKEIDEQVDKCLEEGVFFVMMNITAQTVFTFEAFVKISAEGLKPWKYFTDRENGSWNCIDFFIVAVGFLELTPASFVFKNFPVVLLRLLRLLRVFRLAKTLPRLRSIVEALVSGFSSVGWICILFAVFNYIVACMCMIVFSKNDPFHFGSVGRSMFTIFRIETLDTWDQILYIAMYGCKKYPAGYAFLIDEHEVTQCKHSTSFGWLGVLLLFSITIIGAYVLPVVLIGVVSIKFDKATKLINIIDEEKRRYVKLLETAKENLPDYFTHERLELIEEVFLALDSGGEYSLDMNEIAPLLYYSIAHLFQVELSTQQFESLFYLLDTNHSSEVGIGEVVLFISVLKSISNQTRYDLNYAKKMFQGSKRIFESSATIAGGGGGGGGASSGVNMSNRSRARSSSNGLSRGGASSKSVWDRSMERVDKDTLDTAWDSILRSINGIEGNSLGEKVTHMFKDFDTDHTGELDLSELGAGLKACGIRLNDRQINVLVKSVDVDGDGTVSFEEFAVKITSIRHERAAAQDEEDMLKMEHALKVSGEVSEAFNARKSKTLEHRQSSGEAGSQEELSLLFKKKTKLKKKIARLKAELNQFSVRNGACVSNSSNSYAETKDFEENDSDEDMEIMAGNSFSEMQGIIFQSIERPDTLASPTSSEASSAYSSNPTSPNSNPTSNPTSIPTSNPTSPNKSPPRRRSPPPKHHPKRESTSSSQPRKDNFKHIPSSGYGSGLSMSNTGRSASQEEGYGGSSSSSSKTRPYLLKGSSSRNFDSNPPPPSQSSKNSKRSNSGSREGGAGGLGDRSSSQTAIGQELGSAV